MSFIYADGMSTWHVASGTKKDPIMLEANVVKCPDGSLFMSWTTGGDREPVEENYVAYSRSFDGGRSWTEQNVLFMHPKKGMFCPETTLIDGKIACFPASYFSWDDTSFYQDVMTFISESSDFGRTFTSPRSVGNAINGIHVKNVCRFGERLVGACSFVECDGENWASFKDAKRPCIVAGREYPRTQANIFPNPIYHNEYCGVIISDDDGKTWRLCGKIGKNGMYLVEPAIGQLSDGTLVMLIRHNGDTGLYESRSHDGGETWSEVQKTDIPSTIVKVSLVKDKNGRFYLLNHASNNRYDRTSLDLWISDDDMKTWSQKINLIRSDDGVPCTYPDAFIDEERGMLCFGWDDRRNIYYSEYPIR